MNIFAKIRVFFGFSYSARAIFYANIYALIFLAAKINPFEDDEILQQINQDNNLNFTNSAFQDLFWHKLDYWIYLDKETESKINFLIKKVEKSFYQHKKDLDVPNLKSLEIFKVANNALQKRIFEFLENLEQSKIKLVEAPINIK